MKRFRGKAKAWIPKAGVGGAVVLSLTGILAFKMIFPHSGEKALDLVPDSAVFVATLDLDPAPSQIFTFAQIDSALRRNGFSDSIKGTAQKIESSVPGLDSIWALSKRSVSLCGFSASAKENDFKGALLIPLTDSVKAQQILEQQGKAGVYGGTRCYFLTKAKAYGMIEGDTLVVGQTPWVMSEMAKVPTGQATPVTKSDGYQEARGKEPSDASLLVMVSPRVASFSKQAVSDKNLGWSSFSFTVQSGGVAISSHCKYHPEQNQALANLASTKPLRADLLQLLPAGAYGVYAISQPGHCLATALASEEASPSKDSKDILKGEAEIKRESGMDIQKDIVRGVEGDMVYALYPSAQPTAGVDFLVVADDQNGADPANLVTKLQAFLDKTINKPNKKRDQWYVSVPRSDAVEFKLSPKLEKDIADWKKIDTSGTTRIGTLLNGKTVAWATVGKNVFMATSQALLDRAITAYGKRSQDSLATDSMITAALDSGRNDQTFAVASLARVAEGIKNTTDESKMSADYRGRFDQFLGVIDHLNTPIRFEAAQTSDGTLIGSAFIPIDFGKLIDFIGASQKSMTSAKESPFKA